MGNIRSFWNRFSRTFWNISYSTATGGAIFNAACSTDGGNNTGWNYRGCPRYWVGGTGNFGDSNHWSTYSNGTWGASVPGINNKVFFDSYSGGGICTNESGRDVGPVDFTGYTGTFAGVSYFNVNGDLTFSSSMQSTFTAWITIKNTSKLTFNGHTFSGNIDYFSPTGDTLTLQDDLKVANNFDVTIGTFNANNMNVKCYNFDSYNTPQNRTIIMGSGTWEITGTNSTNFIAFDCSNSNGLNIYPNTSTIKFTNNNSSNEITFAGGGKTYYNLWNARSSNGPLTITGSNTFNDLKINQGKTVKFTDGTVQTVSSITADGTSGNMITLTGTSTAGWTISDLSGVNTIENSIISYSNATGGAIFNAQCLSDGGNNTGWNFLECDYYWVGGSGNWDATSTTHWSTSSGVPEVPLFQHS